MYPDSMSQQRLAEAAKKTMVENSKAMSANRKAMEAARTLMKMMRQKK